ncbi:unnamed protein product, partial [Trichogramma brassicae]
TLFNESTKHTSTRSRYQEFKNSRSTHYSLPNLTKRYFLYIINALQQIINLFSNTPCSYTRKTLSLSLFPLMVEPAP